MPTWTFDGPHRHVPRCAGRRDAGPCGRAARTGPRPAHHRGFHRCLCGGTDSGQPHRRAPHRDRHAGGCPGPAAGVSAPPRCPDFALPGPERSGRCAGAGREQGCGERLVLYELARQRQQPRIPPPRHRPRHRQSHRAGGQEPCGQRRGQRGQRRHHHRRGRNAQSLDERRPDGGGRAV